MNRGTAHGTNVVTARRTIVEPTIDTMAFLERTGTEPRVKEI
jgi:hypothetical protein